jgi:chaperonin GroES
MRPGRSGTRDDAPPDAPDSAHPVHQNRSGGGQTVSVTIKPLEDRILVKTLEAEQTTASGLVIPDTAKEKPQEGEVLAVGPGRFEDGQRLPLDIKVGDKVIYSKYGGTEVKYDGQEYLILSARDILAIVEK